ncbi:MAG: hypothetical protein PHR47_02510 [Candidatus Pacebacteria bacterium]|nr:hypothetical protein [Candidatus Paceibacterota bacterium]
MIGAKKKNIIIVLSILIIIGLIVFGIYFWKTKKESEKITVEKKNEIVLYYGDGCDCCENLMRYIEENKVSEKISFESKEIYNSKTNTDELVNRAEFCNIGYDELSVPLLFDGKKCYEGFDDIINFFKEKTG